MQAEGIPADKVSTRPSHGAVPSLGEIEPQINEAAEEIAGLKASQDLLKKNHNSLLEQQIVLELGHKIYKTQAAPPSEKRDTELMSLSEFGLSSRRTPPCGHTQISS